MTISALSLQSVATERESELLSVVQLSERQRGRRLVVKRFLDRSLASLLLVILSPLFVLVVLVIKLESRGPAIFRQERLGQRGKCFTILKFRSMAFDSDPEVHRQHILEGSDQGGSSSHYKIQADPRITRAGRILRELSLDELPQLINVLRGEMSLVGPRPDVAYSLFQYEPVHYRRFEVLPGMTGLWQVEGRSTLSYRQMLELDVVYVDQWSIWLDLKLLARTIPELLKLGQAG